MKKIILLIMTLIIICLVIDAQKTDYYVIPNEAIRFRIIPNSNSVYDQYMKMKVKNKIDFEMKTSLDGVSNIDEARKSLVNSLDRFDKLVSDTIKNNNYDKTYSINYGMNYFPEKEYKNVKYEEGMYESLVITLGDGKGDNWWCVLFPPICFVNVEESDDIEYSFMVKDLVDKYFLDK